MAEWLKDMSEDMQNNETLKQIPDIATLAKSYVDAQSHIGASIRIPSENAGEADWTKFNDKMKAKVPTLMNRPDLENADQMKQVFEMLGRPADSKGYELEADENMLSAFHDQGLSKKQAKGLTQHFSEVSAKNTGDQDAILKQGMTELANEWGYAFDQRVASAVAILKKTGAPPKLLDAAETGNIGADTLRWAHKMGAALGSESTAFINDGKANGINQKLTPNEARSRQGEILGNKKHAYWNKGDPGNKEAIKEFVELTRTISAK